MDGDVAEAGRAQLGGHVLRGRVRARRPPGVRAERRERRRVAQRRLAVEGGGGEDEDAREDVQAGMITQPMC